MVDRTSKKNQFNSCTPHEHFSENCFSKSLEGVEETEHWKNVRLLHEVHPEEIKKLKQESGKDIAIFGSNNLSVNLLKKQNWQYQHLLGLG